MKIPLGKAVFAGLLTNNFSGAVVTILADGFGGTPPTTGVLRLRNAAGQEDTFPYTVVTGPVVGVYTFTVATTLTYSYLNNEACDIVSNGYKLRNADGVTQQNNVQCRPHLDYTNDDPYPYLVAYADGDIVCPTCPIAAIPGSLTWDGKFERFYYGAGFALPTMYVYSDPDTITPGFDWDCSTKYMRYAYLRFLETEDRFILAIQSGRYPVGFLRSRFLWMGYKDCSQMDWAGEYTLLPFGVVVGGIYAGNYNHGEGPATLDVSWS